MNNNTLINDILINLLKSNKLSKLLEIFVNHDDIVEILFSSDCNKLFVRLRNMVNGIMM